MTPLPYIDLNESNSKLYTKYEFCEGNNLKHLKNTLIYKAKQFIFDKKIKKYLLILENNESSVQVDY